MVSSSEFRSTRDSDRPTPVDSETAQLREQVVALERENRALWADLQACQRSQSAQAQVAELERAYAVLQAEVRERSRCEQVLQGQAQALTRTIAALIAEPNLDQFLGQVLVAIVQQMGEDAGGLWLYVPEIEGVRLYLTYENGQIESAVETAHPGARADRSHQTEQVQQLREHKAVVLDRHHLMTHPTSVPYRAFVQERGIQSVLCVPLFLGEEFLGNYTVRSTRREIYSAEEIDLAYALAQQAVLAIQTTRLAVEAKQAAIAREQEKAAQERAAELAKANEALRQTLDTLATESDLEKFLGKALTILVEQMDGSSGGFWFIDEAQELTWLFLDYDDGQIRVQGELYHPGATPRKPVNEKDRQDRFRFLRDKKPILYNDIANDPALAPHQEYLLAKGIQSVLCVPLVLGDEVIGTFSIRSTQKSTYSPEQLELAEALAQQATLAVQLTRLAEEAKQTAIAREQEKAAQERAAELAKANEALQESLSKLADEPELEKFLGHVLTVCAERLGAIGAGIWQMEENTGYLIASYEDGKVNLPPESSHPGTVRAIAQQSSKQNSKNDTVRLSKGEMLAAYEEDFQSNPDYQPYREYLQQRGIKAILSSPMFLGDSLRGSLTLRFDHRRVLKTEETELAHALTNQAMLALELTRLAEEAKQAAIAREQLSVLTNANAALQQSLNVLLTEPDPEQVLGHILSIIAQQLQVPLTEYWYHPETTAYISMMYWNSRLYSREQIAQLCPNHPGIVGYQIPAAPNRVTHEPLHQRKQYYIIDDRRQTPFLTDVDWHVLHELHREVNLPMTMGDSNTGALIIRLPGDRQLTEQEIELARALTHQATLAIQLIRLAEAAKQAAIAREQEKAAQERAAKLAQANEVLRASAESLTSAEDLDSFLGHVLLAITRQMGARSSTVWLYDWSARVSHLKFVVEDGVAVPAAHSKHPNACQPMELPEDAEHTDTYTILNFGTSRAKPSIKRIADIPYPGLTDEQRHYLAAQGVKALLAAPMLLNNVEIGAFTVRLEDDRPLLEEDLELIQALANQATLAVQLTQLAEEAKQAAIAREQEKAAQERAAELARANIALRQSIDALTTQPSIEAFLSVTLKAIAQVLEVPSACLWKFEDEWAHLQLVYQEGSVIPAEQSDHPNATQPAPYDPSHVTWNPNGKHHTYPYFFFIDDPTWGHKDVYAEMFQTLGVRCLVTAPIVIGERTVASITTRLTHDMPDPSPARLELVSALANQAALALQMAQLAEEAQQAVVLEERNRMAREIHDTLAQSFTGVLAQLEAAKRKLDPLPLETVQAHFARARNLAVSGLAEARRSVRALRPGALESHDLPTALQHLAEQMDEDTATQISFQLEGEPRSLPTEVETNLLRIGQEALTNALRHAHAQTIQLKLLFEPTTVYLSIEDDGQGFDLQQQAVDHGFGLIGMQERSERIDGQFSLISEPGQGTTVTVMITC
ncbi:MAG: GAF domain-containing protein [Leptolyngbya sp. BL-A-14]